MYNQKAFDILNASITSAVFIDDKARDFFSDQPINNNIPEEALSIELFKTFKDNGKSLSVHRFEPTNLDNDKTLDYLFKGRDLILLDWELADLSGQEYSLRLLNKALNTSHINFCCIYSNSNNFNEIPLFLDGYFSGLNKGDFENIKNSYEYIEREEILKLWNSEGSDVNRFFEENQIDLETFPVASIKNKPAALLIKYIYISLSLDKFLIPEVAVNQHEVLNAGNDSFIINNTFILTLKKDAAEDSDYNNLLKRISEIIIKNKGSFFQLLGLEMQSIFNSNERFIDEEILKSSTEALFRFRNHLKNDKAFGTIIKKLLMEQATLKLRTAKLELLKPEFLDFKSNELRGEPIEKDDLFQLNVFYNSVKVKSLNVDDVPNLNFGDVFKDNSNTHYLCITALCDCYEPGKIQFNFYFVKGSVLKDRDAALRLGDTAFVSFLPNNTAVYWGDLESAKSEKIEPKRQEETMDQYRLRKLENEINGYKNFLYKPFYIKPKVFNVENNKLIDNKIRIWDITNKIFEEVIDQKLNYIEVEYVTTLRTDYAQRIANHAFGHSVRVGVDFVKI